MTTAMQDAMIWMNKNFGADIDAAVAGTPITKNLLISIGIQETFYIWAKMYKTAKPEEVLAVCVGDTIDFPKRASAWPKNRADLESHARGKEMFKVARAALVRIAAINSGYKTVVKNPDKFCHGFGMFQYDIQFFDGDKDYFINEKWATWKGTLSRGMSELTVQTKALYGAGKKSLTHDESVYVAIAYNQGAKKTKNNMATRKFKQGYKDDQDVFYGEHIDSNLKATKGLWP
ncbi:SH3 domain-containing protein [Mesorhizobium sp. PL10]